MPLHGVDTMVFHKVFNRMCGPPDELQGDLP